MGRVRVVLAALLAIGAMASCRGLREHDPLPEETGATVDANKTDGGAAIDPAWAQWPMPRDTDLQNIDPGTGVNHDAITKLVWDRASRDAAVWSDAKKACEELELGGHKGFRLPTRIELLSIMDFGLSDTDNPFPGQFLNPKSNCYWTISGETDDTSHWLLATEYSMLVVSTNDATHCVARCVMGAPYDYALNVPPAYEITAKGVVRDPLTHLEWEPAFGGPDSDKLVSIEEASSRCAALVLDDHDDWRLPNVKELSSLVDERRLRSSVDPRVGAEHDLYWSTTTHSPTADAGIARPNWRVSFADGRMVPGDDSDDRPAGTGLGRCVRDR